MFELADSGSSGGLSLRLSISLSFSLSSSSRRLHPLCPSLSSVTFPPVMRRRAMLRWHRCARPRSQRRGPHALLGPPRPLSLPPLRPFSSTFPCLASVSPFLFLSLSFSLFPCTTGSTPVFPGERADRSRVGGEDPVPLYLPEALS